MGEGPVLSRTNCHRSCPRRRTLMDASCSRLHDLAVGRGRVVCMCLFVCVRVGGCMCMLVCVHVFTLIVIFSHVVSV